MNRTKCSIFLTVISILTLNAAGQSDNPVSFELEKKTVSAGEPVLVRVHAQNKSSQPLEFDLGHFGKDDILIRVTGPTGIAVKKPTPPPDPSGSNGVVFFGWMHLEPGESYSKTLVLNEWFKFADIGTYKIEMRLTKPARIGGQAVPVQTSFDLGVTPYDVGQLESACRRLAEEVVHPLPDQTALGATEALRLIDDRNLVSFWSDLLQRTNHQDLQEIAVAKLEHLNTQEGVRELAQALRSHNRATRSLVRSALERVAANASDMSLRRTAQDLLGGTH